MQLLLTKEFRFEASHQLPNHPGKCRNLHGHSWVLEVTVRGELDESTGMVMDYGDIKAAVQPIVDRLDHQHLGNGFVNVIFGTKNMAMSLKSTVEGLAITHPTSENLLIWIAEQLPADFPWSFLKIKETCTSQAILSREASYLK